MAQAAAHLVKGMPLWLSVKRTRLSNALSFSLSCKLCSRRGSIHTSSMGCAVCYLP